MQIRRIKEADQPQIVNRLGTTEKRDLRCQPLHGIVDVLRNTVLGVGRRFSEIPLLKFISGLGRHKILVFLAAILFFSGLIFVFYGGLDSPSVAIKKIVFSVGKQVETDDLGHTNILLLGTGGGIHDGADLTDTIIIASIDHNKKMVSMLSIPRDLYLKTSLTGGSRINAIYDLVKSQKGDSKAALEYLKSELSEKFDLKIHYYAKVNFAGFSQIVDSLDGIDVDVTADIVDPFYPKGETIDYETFIIRKGMQHLDGETALKYVRSRKTTSDFDRSRRQQQVINAIKDKALSLKTLTDPGKLGALYESIASNYETDLSSREIIYLGSLAEEIKGEGKIVMNVLHDDPSRSGGILYTPMREFYNGMYVLLPQGDDFVAIARFANFVLYNPGILKQSVSLQILNGTRNVGLAARVRQKLQLLGFRVPRYGNAKTLDIETTVLYVRNPDVDLEVARFLADYLRATLIMVIPTEYNELPYKSNSDLVLEIGSNFIEPR